MKESIIIKNFGPLKEVEIDDIKPLTVFIGKSEKAELELFLKQNVCINKNEYIQLSGLTRHAAIDELNNFIRQGFLRRRGMGRSTVYVRQEKDTANEI